MGREGVEPPKINGCFTGSWPRHMAMPTQVGGGWRPLPYYMPYALDRYVR